ncbi:MAG: hypothetical protein QOE59_5247 [Actinomycetota bacterium]|jgi:hypothetical protein|nr:hypothetical protein [Actinomycetota bacterium]
MTSDRDMTLPDDGPSVSIVDTACGTVVRTREVLGFVAAVWLRRVALRHHPGGLVLLDVRATCATAPVVVAAVADLADGLRARGDALLIVRSPRTPQALVGAASAPVYASLAEAFGCRSCASDSHWVDLPTRPSDRLPPTIGGRGGMGPGRSPLTPGTPVRIHPASLPMPHPRRPEGD